MGRPLESFKKAPKLDYIPPEQWAYMAGLMDGEGCISVAHIKSKDRFYCRVTIGQTDPSSLRWVQETIGGSLVLRKRPYPEKPIWIWHPGGTEFVREFIHGVFPYLKVKKPQAKLVLRYRPNRALYERIKQLNKRGL